MTDDGVRLDNGAVLPTDLVVLTAGGRPSTALARRAGLMVGRGVVVDSTLASVTDDRIHAIGDCAEHRRRTTGFVPPAWEQAEVLARVLRGEEATYDGLRSVARLRATGLEVAVLGDPQTAEGEVVEVTNPIAGSHRRLVVHGGRIVAAALVGDLSRVGLITQLYDRGHHPRPRRARPAPAARGRRRAHDVAGRGGGLRLRGRHRGGGPGLRIGGGVRRPDPRDHRLRRVRGCRTPSRRGADARGPARLRLRRGDDAVMTDVQEFRITLTVDDFDAAVRLYRDALGLPEVADWSSDEGRVLLLDAGRATLELFDERQAAMVDDLEVGRRVSGTVRFALRVPDADATATALTAAGATSVGPPVDTPWGDRNARVAAPDGMQLTLFTPGAG